MKKGSKSQNKQNSMSLGSSKFLQELHKQQKNFTTSPIVSPTSSTSISKRNLQEPASARTNQSSTNALSHQQWLIDGVQKNSPDKNLINGHYHRRGGSKSQRSDGKRKNSTGTRKERQEITQDKVDNERLRTQVKLLQSKVAIDDNLMKNFEVVKEQLDASENARKTLQN